MNTTPNQPQESVVYETSPVPRCIPIALGVLFVLVGFLLYAGHSARKSIEAEMLTANQRADQLAEKLEASEEKIADLRGELEVTSQKLGITQEELTRARALAQNIRKEQQQKDQELASQLAATKTEAEQKIGAVATEVSGAKSDIAATRQDLEATKARLTTTIGDLGVQSGLIARNREEVEQLKRLGERSIFDFDIRKSKERARIGPVLVELKKVDTKRNRYTLDLYADDRRVEKKDKTVMEPVQFYVRGARAPYELVVFELSKDRIVGYLSTPKELAARQ